MIIFFIVYFYFITSIYKTNVEKAYEYLHCIWDMSHKTPQQLFKQKVLEVLRKN